MATTDNYSSKGQMLNAPAAERNKKAIADVLKEIVPTGNVKVLEVASGTGQHAVHLASELPHLTWQPSECDENSTQSIVAYIDASGVSNVAKPVYIDTTKPVKTWADSKIIAGDYDVIFCANMMHIAPFEASVGLFRGAGYYLKPGGILASYGPYAINGKLTPDSNVQFDSTLRMRNPEWGIRDTKELQALAIENGLTLKQKFPMPANNFILVFEKQ